MFTSRARGPVSHCGWLVDLRGDDALICWRAGASSHTKHIQSAQISFTPLCLSLMEIMCELIRSQIQSSALFKW